MKSPEEIKKICQDIIDSESVNEEYKQAVYEGCVLGYIKCEMDNMDKKFTSKDMKLYAQHCMNKLLTKEREDGIGEISSYDLTRIDKILNDK